MPSLQDQLSRLVYSTDQGQVCPDCAQSIEACECASQEEAHYLAGLSGIIRMRKETSGRKGKGVTALYDIPLPLEELKKLAAELKKFCGTGGALKDRAIEIQGDQRDKLQAYLEKKGYRIKRVGG